MLKRPCTCHKCIGNFDDGVTFAAGPEAMLDASTARLPMDRTSLTPIEFARIFTLFSLVETANSIPELLNRMQGEA